MHPGAEGMVLADGLTHTHTPLALTEVMGAQRTLSFGSLSGITQPNKNKPGAEEGKNVQELGIHPVQRSWGGGDLHGRGKRRQLILSSAGCPPKGINRLSQNRCLRVCWIWSGSWLLV